MNAQDFAYWLKGFVEMNPNAMVTGTQWQIVKDHLELVFKKETPNRGLTHLSTLFDKPQVGTLQMTC